MPTKKSRLDLLLVQRDMAPSRQRAQAMIMGGLVLVDRIPIDKPGTQVSQNSDITLRGMDHPYVSRGGLKLGAALEEFPIAVTGTRCLDVGASTGGFTDCLLQHGARHVIAVDVGYGQLAWSLRQDPRVTVFERTNIRHMPITAIDRPVDLVTIDTSFISLRIVVPAAIRFLKPEGSVIALIKPQFEVGRRLVGKGGVVRDTALHRQVIDDLTRFFVELGLRAEPAIPSPIRGPKGNQEYLIWLRAAAPTA